MDNENLPIVEVEGVRGFVDKNNVAWLNAEDIARELGFTETKNGVAYVMWRRVNGYLREFKKICSSSLLTIRSFSL